MTSNKLHEKYSNYHYCIVQECKNTSIKTPGKLWIKVPKETSIRNTWLKLANRDPLGLSTTTQMFFCEDHFDLEKDMENYTQYKLMGSVKKIRMKPGCIPSRFECHNQGKRKFASTPNEPQPYSKKRAICELGDIKQDVSTETSTSSFHQELLNEDNVVPCSLQFLDKAVQVNQHNSQFSDQATQIQPVIQHVSCQVLQDVAHKVTQATITKHYRSKHVQVKVLTKDAESSPINLLAFRSIATSPNKPLDKNAYKPSKSGQSLTKRKLTFLTEDKIYDSDLTYSPSQGGSSPIQSLYSIESSPSKPSSQTTGDSVQERIIKDQQLHLQSTEIKIKQKPRTYIGIPADLYFIVDLISKHTKLSKKHILLGLMKIRLNRTFSQLADDFGVSLSQASKIFYNTIPKIVGIISPIVKKFTKSTIKKNLPMAFRHTYNRVNCIIDCLEIEIQKSTKAIHQAMTWSEYKKTNTIKYLVACTPDGLVSFVSAGYGGRISDVSLLERSNFLDSLEPSSCILADRGFKHIEVYLNQKGFTLLRPPSVSVGSKLSRDEAKHTKEIASLRIHVERVIRRIREFAFLKQHSVVNLYLLSILDYCVVIACALINLQDSLIK